MRSKKQAIRPSLPLIRFPRFAQSSGRFAQLHALSQFQNIQKKFKTKKQHSQAEIFPTLAYSNSASFSILFIFLKNAMAKAARGCTCPPEFPVCVCGKKPQVKLITRKPIVSAEEELTRNPRARSAKLRICEKCLSDPE